MPTKSPAATESSSVFPPCQAGSPQVAMRRLQGRPEKRRWARMAIGFTLVLGAPQDGKCEKDDNSMSYVDTGPKRKSWDTYLYCSAGKRLMPRKALNFITSYRSNCQQLCSDDSSLMDQLRVHGFIGDGQEQQILQSFSLGSSNSISFCWLNGNRRGVQIAIQNLLDLLCRHVYSLHGGL